MTDPVGPGSEENVRVSRSEAETEEIGEELGRTLVSSDVVYISGGLGAGKTAFARGLARGVGARSGQVASPTFSIVNEYAGDAGRIVLRHLDLYRLEDRELELARIGVPDALAGAPVAVEWPGHALRAVLPPRIEVQIIPAPDGTRQIRIIYD